MFLEASVEWQGLLVLAEGLPAAIVIAQLGWLDLLADVPAAAVANVAAVVAAANLELDSPAAPAAEVVVVLQMLAGLVAARQFAQVDYILQLP